MSMATPSALFTGIDRKNTLSCGAVRFTRPSPSVARNMMMITGAEMTTVVRSIPSSAPRTWIGASDAKDRLAVNTGQTA